MDLGVPWGDTSPVEVEPMTLREQDSDVDAGGGEALVSQRLVDPFVRRAFEAMCAGVKANQALVGRLLPRVSPEAAVVAAATDGLLSSHRGDAVPYRVGLEGTVGGLGRIDLVIADDSATPLLVEFKVFWPLGIKECAGGITNDRRKVAGRRGLVVVFAYAVREAPAECKQRCTEKNLDDAIASAGLGEPPLKGDAMRIEDSEVIADCRLLAWLPMGASG